VAATHHDRIRVFSLRGCLCRPRRSGGLDVRRQPQNLIDVNLEAARPKRDRSHTSRLTLSTARWHSTNYNPRYTSRRSPILITMTIKRSSRISYTTRYAPAARTR